MRKAVRVNTTLDDDLLERIDMFASQRREDRSTAIRQLVDIGLRELSKRDALDAYRQGRVTLREFASVLNLGIWAAHDLLLAEGVAVAQGSPTETSAAVQTLLGASTARFE
ncbi:MAG: hypothetical protein JF886_03370 [Candidatus Dormibacteraeota bacterium]|uniref:Ribbon-helix-helix protein CopG domain-containing protein n=1 Tax=Candidatus Aeolococcus gillhamiae TaxID=3127015 RepID=A0A2W5ZXJ4_9BACT|nr:hypothetical protein [Candidatus Dormibacteraeota bacterium]PZR78048.1 MAG: hypothetical protein DLM65_14215 [Candidatus Dormibacter sp. RRmetagenome_bin12]